jgi:hypothetical protein
LAPGGLPGGRGKGVEGTRVHLRGHYTPFPGFATTRPEIPHLGVLVSPRAGRRRVYHRSVLLELHIAPLEGTEDVTELRPGPSALTGETGAGKTMVREGLALGRWAGAGPVRDGATEASLFPVDAARERS